MVKQRLEAAGFRVEIFLTGRRGEARDFAAQAAAGAADMIICAGGDGTIHEVINGMAGGDLVLGLIPSGTGNVLAWELGIPRNTFRACEILASGRVKEIDLMRSSEGIYSSCMAGIGIDAQAVKDLNLALKGLLGVMAYPVSGIRTLMNYDLPEMSIEIDGKKPPYVGYAMVVCNSRHYGGRFTLCPKARIDDGLLDICILHERNRYSLLWTGMAVLLGLPGSMRSISFYRGRAVRVSTEKPVPIQVDGEASGITPVEFQVIPRSLKIMCPNQ